MYASLRVVLSIDSSIDYTSCYGVASKNIWGVEFYTLHPSIVKTQTGTVAFEVISSLLPNDADPRTYTFRVPESSLSFLAVFSDC